MFDVFYDYIRSSTSRDEIFLCPRVVSLASASASPMTPLGGIQLSSSSRRPSFYCFLYDLLTGAFSRVLLSLSLSLNSKLDRLISRSGKPFDLLTFYGEVCRRGGFGRNRVEAKCRFSISKIFKVMFNYFDQHSYTDIGNKLFDVYELFFLPYERAHSQEDVAEKWENREGVPRVQDIANQFYYLRERKEVEKAQIAMHLRRGKKYDPNFVPMFRMSVHRSLLEGENNVNNDNDAKGVEQEKNATNCARFL